MRIIALFVVTSALCASVFAQVSQGSTTRYYRHEVNVSRTAMFLPRSQWDDYENEVYQAMVYEREHDYVRWFNPSSSGTLISYYYHLNLQIGLTYRFGRY